MAGVFDLLRKRELLSAIRASPPTETVDRRTPEEKVIFEEWERTEEARKEKV
jgi:hypothetical protein